MSSEEPIRFVRPNLPDARYYWSSYGKEWNITPPVEDFINIVKSGMISNAEWCRKQEGWATTNLGARHAVAVSSCTSGLMLAARALGKPGMRSVLPSWTWISTGLAAMEAGMKPLFVDIDPATLTMDTSTGMVESLTIAPNVFGVDPSYDLIPNGERNPLILDSAHAIASKYHGKPVGGIGDCAVFSLSPSKFATGGEGGIITTNDADLADRLRVLRDVGGQDRECVGPGLNAKLSEFNAMVAWHSLQQLDTEVSKRNVVGDTYDSAFSEAVDGGLISLQHRPAYNEGSGRQYYPIILPTEQVRAQVDRATQEADIPTRAYYNPHLHEQEWFRHIEAPFGLTVTRSVSRRILHLPIHSGISETAANAIADVVLGAL